MKILKINAILLIVMLALASCEEKDPEIFDGENTDNQVLTGFSDEQYNLPVALDSTGVVEVNVETTTISEQDRVFDIDTINTGDENEAFPETYSIPSTVTIPAGEYIGTFTITGEDNDMVETSPRFVEIELSSQSDDPLYSIQQTQIRVFEFCPVPNDFLVGEYNLEDASATIGPGNDSANFASETVTIEIGETSTERVFTATILPGIAGEEQVTLDLICNEFILREIDPGIACTDPPYIYVEASNKTTYDIFNPQDEYVINYTEDPEGSCGGPFNSSFRLSKVE